MGEWLAEAGAGQIVLMARGAPSPAAEHAALAMRERGARVTFARGDVAEAADVARVVLELASTGLPLRGVIHAAGVLSDGVVTEQDRERLAQVMAPKVRGAWHLHESTRALELDFFVLFASVAGVLGGSGQLGYAAANAFLDGFSQYRNARGLAATSIDWGPWSGAGMAATLDAERLWERGLRPLAPADARETVERVLRQGSAQICALHVDWSRYRKHHGLVGEPGLSVDLERRSSGDGAVALEVPEEKLSDVLAAVLPAQRLDILLEHLQRLARSVLGYAEGDRVRRNQPLVEQGFDSLMAVEMRNRMTKWVGQRLPASLLFDYPTLERLAQHLLDDVLGLTERTEPEVESPRVATAVVDRLTRLLNGG